MSFYLSTDVFDVSRADMRDLTTRYAELIKERDALRDQRDDLLKALDRALRMLPADAWAAYLTADAREAIAATAMAVVKGSGR